MNVSRRPRPGRLWLVAIILLGCLAAGGLYLLQNARPTIARATETAASGDADATQPTAVPVRVVKPRLGQMEHQTVLPASVESIETIRRYAQVSGYLKEQSVDIGDRVKKGQVIAVVDVPEQEKLAERNAAAVQLADAKVQQFQARIVSAEADVAAAEAAVLQSEASAKSAAAWVRFRNKQLSRMQELYRYKSIDEKMVDESQERAEAAFESERSARAAIATSKAQLAAAHAKVKQAEADLVGARADVKVAQAELDKSKVLLNFAKITSPFDGVITHRALFPGDFVRSASEGGHEALLTIQRTDRMRAIIQVPDREVPFTDPGDPATIVLDALPGESFPAKVSRIAQSEDPQTRLMHVEVDLLNPNGRIRQGMYGKVTILLDKAPNIASVPSACLFGKSQGGKGNVYVVRDGQARLTPVKLGTDNGVRVEVLKGVQPTDEVIFQPGNNLHDGIAVDASPADRPAAAAAEQ